MCVILYLTSIPSTGYVGIMIQCLFSILEQQDMLGPELTMPRACVPMIAVVRSRPKHQSMLQTLYFCT